MSSNNVREAVHMLFQSASERLVQQTAEKPAVAPKVDDKLAVSDKFNELLGRFPPQPWGNDGLYPKTYYNKDGSVTHKMPIWETPESVTRWHLQALKEYILSAVPDVSKCEYFSRGSNVRIVGDKYIQPKNVSHRVVTFCQQAALQCEEQ